MELQPCGIAACGAKVLVVEVDGVTIPVNPVRTAVVIPAEAGGFVTVHGYLPHAYTCVNIAQRSGIRSGKLPALQPG